MARRGGCCMIFNMAFAALGVFGGFSVFVMFFFHYENHPAGLWAFFSGIYAALALFIHILFNRHTLELWYTPSHLLHFSAFGGVGLISGLIAGTVYIANALKSHEGMPTLDNLSSSFFMMAVWAFMTTKWSATLTIFAFVYRRRLLQEYHTLEC